MGDRDGRENFAIVILLFFEFESCASFKKSKH